MTVPIAVAPLLVANSLRGMLPGQGVPYGMTMWFQVHADHLGRIQPLGKWSSCKNLGLKINTEPVKEGSRYDQPRFVPTALTYNDIVLERAMEHSEATTVRTWLEQVVAGWVNGDDGGAPTGYRGTTVVIRLFSALERSPRGGTNEVARWELRNVYPVAWSGPQLDSKSGGVAMETLTLAHNGFLNAGAKVMPKAAGLQKANDGRLKLTRKDTSQVLELQYQPDDLDMEKTVTIKDGNKGPTYVLNEQIITPGKLNFSFTAQVEGAAAVKRVTALLLDWLEPITPPPAAPASNKWVSAQPGGRTKPTRGLAPPSKAGAKANSAQAKVLLLQVGAGAGSIARDVIIKQANTKFTRFTTTGVPSRASIGLKFEEAPQALPGTNPTSGGPPGSTVHTITEGDSLARIAHDTYGSPGSWREIAERNGIDDPLRLRNGAALFLPGG